MQKLYFGDVHFRGNRSLEHFDGENNPVFLLFPDQDAFKACQRAALDAYPTTNLQVRVRLDADLTGQFLTQPVNLGILQREGGSIEADQTRRAGSLKNSQTVAQIDAYQDVAGEERQLQCLAPVLPPPHGFIEGAAPAGENAAEYNVDAIVVATDISIVLTDGRRSFALLLTEAISMNRFIQNLFQRLWLFSRVRVIFPAARLPGPRRRDA